nr:retrovirus-related Pol polyprotein from transposon TNT 1-94 [Tanacetum cinerariifolium]
MVKVKVLMALVDDENVAVSKESAKNATEYDSADESSVSSTPLPPLEKLAGVEPYIDPYKKPRPIITEANAFLDQNDQADQNDQDGPNDHHVQAAKILIDDQPEHSNHKNDNHIIDNLPIIVNVQITEPLSSSTKDTLVNIIGNLGFGMLTRAMAKELSAASANECLFVDFISKEETKKVFEALRHPRWVARGTKLIFQKQSMDSGSCTLWWMLLIAQIIQCLEGKTGGFDQISNKDATILYCLANGVDIDYARLIWEDIINKLNKKTRKKVVPYPRFLSLLLEHKTKEYGNDNMTLNPTQIFRHDASTTFTDEADPRKTNPNDSVSQQQDSLEDDQPIIVEYKEEEEVHAEKDQAEKVHTKDPKETEDTLASQPPSLTAVKIQKLSTQLLLLQTLNSKLVKEKNVIETEAALLIAKPSFINMEQLTELLVKSLKPKLSKLLTSYDFSNSLPTELKELPLKYHDLTGEVKELKKYVEKLEVKVPGDLKKLLAS